MKQTFERPLRGIHGERSGQYFYKVTDTKHKKPYTRKICPTCGRAKMMQTKSKFCSMRCAQLGENNSTWAGDRAGYLAKHGRQYRAEGLADHCIFGCPDGPFDWANLNADNNSVGDWGFAPMCRTCHSRYDGAVAKCMPKTCQRGHELTDETMYVYRRPGKMEVRQCMQCAKDRARNRRGGGE